MQPLGELTEMLCCPRCGGSLAGADGGCRCERCSAGYPAIGGIPCLVEDPALWRTLWLRRLDDYSSGIEARLQTLQQEAEMPELLPRTRQRLLRIGAGFAAQLAAVDALFEPLQAGADLLPSVAIPSRPEIGSQSAILECYEHLFRDWVWGERECAETMEFLAPLVPERLARVAVYGAGAGRLAVDLHQTRAPGRTFALDVNPLPFLVVDRMLAGATVELPEFPIDPNSDDAVVVARSLAQPFPVRDGFSLLFADALRPPFPAASLDAVVTVWFIDVARADVRQTAAAINRVLKPGGLWVNLGPLRFHSVLSRSYTIEEVHEIVGASAFDIASRERRDIPYFDSPVSGSRRTDTVFRFAARKTGDAAPVEIPDPLPSWIRNPLEPIPITPALIALGRTSMFTTGVLSMIDGSRSIVEVARELGLAWGVEPGRLHDELRAFLARLPG
jgi:uncharacterized protein YbaR (Trm112 family)